MPKPMPNVKDQQESRHFPYRRLGGSAVITQRGSRGKFELVSPSGLRPADRARGKLEHRVRGETGRQPPRRHIAPDLFHSYVAVQVNEIDGELHAEGVYSFAGEDPQTFSGPKPLTAQQTLSALRAVIRHFRAMGKLGVAGEVGDPQAKIGLRPATPGEAVEDGADRIHQFALGSFHLEMRTSLRGGKFDTALANPGASKCDKHAGHLTNVLATN